MAKKGRLSNVEISSIEAMAASGMPVEEIAEALKRSEKAILTHLKGEPEKEEETEAEPPVDTNETQFQKGMLKKNGAVIMTGNASATTDEIVKTGLASKIRRHVYDTKGNPRE
jgi:predicted transcriptional regulator